MGRIGVNFDIVNESVPDWLVDRISLNFDIG